MPYRQRGPFHRLSADELAVLQLAEPFEIGLRGAQRCFGGFQVGLGAAQCLFQIDRVEGEQHLPGLNRLPGIGLARQDPPTDLKGQRRFKARPNGA